MVRVVSDFPMPTNLDVERSVLGALLVAGDAIAANVVLDVGLAPEDFYRERHRLIYRAMRRLYSDLKPIEVLTVADALRETGDLEAAGGEGELLELAEAVPLAGNAKFYAEIVKAEAQRRGVILTAQQMIAEVGARERDVAQITADALDRLGKVSIGSHAGDSKTPLELADEFWNEVVEGEGVEVFQTGWSRVDRLLGGGLRRGQLYLFGGYEGVGKSYLVDGILERAARDGHRVHLYATEMTRKDRLARWVAPRAGIRYEDLMAPRADRPLSEKTKARILEALNHVPFGITDASGWSVEQIAHDVIRNGWAVACLDVLHAMHFEDTADLDRMTRQLVAAGLAGQQTALMVVVHLKEDRRGDRDPKPRMRDIRNTGMLAKFASGAVFLHRDQRRDGDEWVQEPTGSLIVDKARFGFKGTQAPIHFDVVEQSFKPGKPFEAPPVSQDEVLA